MTKIRFIGDLHGKVGQYLAAIDGVKNSIQLGDFGIGFGTRGDPAYIDKAISEIPGNHRFIRGNHDNPEKCKESKYWIKDGTIENDTMFIGGAFSIDQQYRTAGVSWWPEEELSYVDLDTLIGIYDVVRPKIMVTHTAPISIPRDHMGFRIFGEGSRTEMALQRMYEIHRPETWLFGHWHKSYDFFVGRTRFICLNELEYIDLDI